ncbi:hypothetical protein F5Y11DRAFT_358581 [Daldinia sp. FL1419]|nr:hypothetical protein F5Y11DRAFT_358581 [Daldinia sp. FL1419]
MTERNRRVSRPTLAKSSSGIGFAPWRSASWPTHPTNSIPPQRRTSSRNGKARWIFSCKIQPRKRAASFEERGVQGVAKVVAHRRITTIFRGGDIYFEDMPSVTASSSASGHKRKSPSDVTPDNGPRSKRSRPNSKKLQLPRNLNDQPSIAGKAKPSLYTTSEDLWDDKIFSCLVVSPAGRVISEFNTARELLESMRDAIKAHQSLYTTGNILHRNISSNNIIITKPTKTDGFKGMFIDLDLAKVRDSGPSGARHQTGTIQFMTVEVLRKTHHTCRHDLESFFYVLLWMCTRQSWHNTFSRHDEQAPKESFLREWEIGSFAKIARSKEGDMTINRLERIMNEFLQSLDIASLRPQVPVLMGSAPSKPDVILDRTIKTFNYACECSN